MTSTQADRQPARRSRTPLVIAIAVIAALVIGFFIFAFVVFACVVDYFFALALASLAAFSAAMVLTLLSTWLFES